MSEQDGKTVPNPRGEARRRAFLEAARTVFYEQGYGPANVNDVVRLAGGSLATLYAQFGSKEGLFLAVMLDGVNQLMEPISAITAAHKPVAEGLQEIGELFLARMISPEGSSLYRIIVGEARTYPQMMSQFMAMGPERLRSMLRQYLAERAAAGEVRITDGDQAAYFFLDMVRARHQITAVTQKDYTLTQEEMTAHVARAVDIFLNGVAKR